MRTKIYLLIGLLFVLTLHSQKVEAEEKQLYGCFCCKGPDSPCTVEIDRNYLQPSAVMNDQIACNNACLNQGYQGGKIQKI